MMKMIKYFYFIMFMSLLVSLVVSCEKDLINELVSESVEVKVSKNELGTENGGAFDRNNDDEEDDEDDEDDEEDEDDEDNEDNEDEDEDEGEEDNDVDNDNDNDDEDEDEGEDDEDLVKHPTLYFVQLDPTISESEVKDLLDDLGSEEVWYRDEINLRLWNTISFIGTDAAGNPVTGIDGQIARARTRARVSNATPNLGGSLATPATSPQAFCFDQAINPAPEGSNNVKISIFDTGIEAGLLSGYTGYDYVEEDDEPQDANGHGTQIASLIQSMINEYGLAQNITFDIRKTHDANGLGFVSNLIPAILDAVQDGVNIFNFSFSYQDFNEDSAGKPMRLAIDYAEQNGVLIAAAAGNLDQNNDSDPLISFPASFPNKNIIAIASINCQRSRSFFSSYGRSSVDLALLGENIPLLGLNNTNVNQSGTSFSTAMVTAMAGIMASSQSQIDPKEIKCALIRNSVYNESLRNLVVSRGVVDFQAALKGLGRCQSAF